MSIRPWLVWSLLIAFSVLLLGMFGWITRRALQAEEERLKAEAAALLGERVRLSLARMDTVGSDLLVLENMNPPMFYRPYFSPSDIFTNQLQDVEKGIVLQPSPLMSGPGEMIHLHFEIDPAGQISSPQIPRGNQLERAVVSGLDESRIRVAASRLETLRDILPPRRELAGLFRDQALPEPDPPELANLWLSANAVKVPAAEAEMKEAYQDNLDFREQQSRAMDYQSKVGRATKALVPAQAKKERDESPIPDPDALLGVSPFLPFWQGENLFFFREVRRIRSVSYQGFWVAREALEATLLTQLPADLGEVNLVRAATPDPASPSLVSLPWKLEIGRPAKVSEPAWTPLRKTLLAGWAAALFALLALFLLLRGVMKLSARREAFVSSVTHELRTPLTTFRLYSEMLAEGMVTGEEQKREYLRTMFTESERLNHLVENVLSYARIEKGNARSRVEKMPVSDLIARIAPVLRNRTEQEGAELLVELAPELGEIETDRTAVGQILFNLIDNACKYGMPEAGKGKVKLQVGPLKNGVEIRVSDEGRGIAPEERRRLFRAFHKSALDAAHDKPGVGLGLALSHRLAKALGGSLTFENQPGPGASFALRLP